MFWCVVLLYIFARCLYFDSPYVLVKIWHNSFTKIHSNTTTLFPGSSPTQLLRGPWEQGWRYLHTKTSNKTYNYMYTCQLFPCKMSVIFVFSSPKFQTRIQRLQDINEDVPMTSEHCQRLPMNFKCY